jgi:hypothetical protein
VESFLCSDLFFSALDSESIVAKNLSGGLVALNGEWLVWFFEEVHFYVSGFAQHIALEIDLKGKF